MALCNTCRSNCKCRRGNLDGLIREKASSNQADQGSSKGESVLEMQGGAPNLVRCHSGTARKDLQIIEKDFCTGIGQSPEGALAAVEGLGILVNERPVRGFLVALPPSLGGDGSGFLAFGFCSEAKVRP